MSPAYVLAMIVALVLGVAIGALVFRRRTPAPDLEEPFAQAEPIVPSGVSEVLAMHSAAGVVVGPHDEVIEPLQQ